MYPKGMKSRCEASVGARDHTPSSYTDGCNPYTFRQWAERPVRLSTETISESLAEAGEPRGIVLFETCRRGAAEWCPDYTGSRRRALRALRSDRNTTDFAASTGSDRPGGRGDIPAFRSQLFTRFAPSARSQWRV